MSNVFLIIISTLLMCITVYISCLAAVWFAEGRKWEETIKGAVAKMTIRSGSLAANRRPNDGPVRMTLMDRLQLKYIDRSGIARFVPFFNSKALLVLCCILMLVLFFPVFRIVGYIPA